MPENYHIPAGTNEFLYPAADRLYSIIFSGNLIFYVREYQHSLGPFNGRTLGVWRHKRK